MPRAIVVSKKKWCANDMTHAVRCCKDINYDLAFSAIVTKPLFSADEKTASRQQVTIYLLAAAL